MNQKNKLRQKQLTLGKLVGSKVLKKKDSSGVHFAELYFQSQNGIKTTILASEVIMNLILQQNNIILKQKQDIYSYYSKNEFLHELLLKKLDLDVIEILDLYQNWLEEKKIGGKK